MRRGQQRSQPCFSGSLRPASFLCPSLSLLNILSLALKALICLSLPVPPSPISLCVPVDFYLDLCLPPLCISAFSFCLSLWLSLSLCSCLSHSLSLSFSPSLYLPLRICLYFHISSSLCFSLHLAVCLSVSLQLPPSTPRGLPSPSLYHPWISEGLCPQDGSGSGSRGLEGGIQ